MSKQAVLLQLWIDGEASFMAGGYASENQEYVILFQNEDQ